MLVVVDGVVALRGKDEISRDQLRALMQQLVERVLSVCRRLTKQNSARADIDKVSAPSYCLAVGLH